MCVIMHYNRHETPDRRPSPQIAWERNLISVHKRQNASPTFASRIVCKAVSRHQHDLEIQRKDDDAEPKPPYSAGNGRIQRTVSHTATTRGSKCAVSNVKSSNLVVKVVRPAQAASAFVCFQIKY